MHAFRYTSGKNILLKSSLSLQQLTHKKSAQDTSLRGSRHTNPRYPTRPKDIHLENLENTASWEKEGTEFFFFSAGRGHIPPLNLESS